MKHYVKPEVAGIIVLPATNLLESSYIPIGGTTGDEKPYKPGGGSRGQSSIWGKEEK